MTEPTATQPKRPEASLGELVTEMTSELGALFRQEVELAKVEARQEASEAARAGALMAGAALTAWLAALMMSLALAWLLDQGINRALAFLLVGLLWAGVTAALFSIGRARLEGVRGLPKTKESIKEDVEWARAQKS